MCGATDRAELDFAHSCSLGIVNNIAGTGPDANVPEELRYRQIASTPYGVADLVVTAQPGWAYRRYLSPGCHACARLPARRSRAPFGA